MAILLYDLAGADEALRFSPYCWRTRLALAHKDLPVETRPWRFSEKSALAPFGYERVPVLIDNGQAVADSWTIAEYLEDTYPDRPSLFEGPGGRAHARFINAWADQVMMPLISRMVVRDVWAALAPQDQHYFRTSRESRFGCPLEDVVADREATRETFGQALAPVRAVLRAQEWLGGEGPSYADYIVFGGLQWARCISRCALLDPADPLSGWRTRVLDLFGGVAAAAPRV